MWLQTSVLVLCLGLSNAAVTWQLLPFEGDCTKFYFQIGPNSVFKFELKCSKDQTFSATTKQCVTKFGRLDDCSMRSPPELIARSYDEGKSICATDPTAVFADEENCAGFYNCSKVVVDDTGNLPPFRDECPYPALFDRINKRCDMDYTTIEPQCGSRKIKPSPCDQLQNQCPRAHCIPCGVRYPNCVGKRNGFQEWEGRSFSPYYANCQDGRTLEAGTCARSRSGSPRIFSPTQKECVDVDSKTLFGN
ncbi:hypothetical protein LOTGIDRAFT_236509 [Lottia gigantea]|uniref:Chitin-binding type-2 domain-containing protein n=1 Tax=Lottia gigantea TaxID=225164 RepID=V3YZN7_LOTGI|nr:hypothetical protein LOTGIDRAFT_236509 [Lottia gigantea]ESO83673.1 hypothetical protein LOTGIDRAFT_236509 [Lottia gigantea]